MKRFELKKVEKETVDTCSKCGARIKWSYWIKDNENNDVFPVGSECAYYYQISDSNLKKTKKIASAYYLAVSAIEGFIELYKNDLYDVDNYKERKPYHIFSNVNIMSKNLSPDAIWFIFRNKVIAEFDKNTKTLTWPEK